MTGLGEEVKVAGLVKMSTTDWPGKLAAVVFLQGCPWRCVYCHNEAILDPKAPAAMPWSDVIDFLEKRRALLDGVVFSGGEPLIDAALPAAMRSVKAMGFSVGLHTGGAWPQRLANLLDTTVEHHPAAGSRNHGLTVTERLVDWVGLDIKHLRDKYAQVTGVKVSGKAAYESLHTIVQAGTPHEVRTTIDPTVHTRDDVQALIAQLRDYRSANGNRVEKHVLQEARAQGAATQHAEAFNNWRLRNLIAEHECPEVVRRAA